MLRTELQREVEKDSARYIRHQLRSGNSSNSNSNANSTAPSPAANGKTNGSSNAHLALPEKIDAAYVELNNLSDEKIALAGRLVELFMRTRARLDIDLSKVRVLQGEVPEPLPSWVGLGKEETSPNVSVKVEKPAPLTDSALRKAESMLKSAQATGIPVDRGSPTPSNGGNPTKSWIHLIFPIGMIDPIALQNENWRLQPPSNCRLVPRHHQPQLLLLRHPYLAPGSLARSIRHLL